MTPASQPPFAAATARPAGSEDGILEGYASLFGVPDLGRDVVERGAFRASLARRGAAGVRLLWQHDPAQPLGRWLAIVEDERGLFVRGRLNLAVSRAREILALLRDGAIDGLSIGFRTDKADADPRTGLRRLKAIDLWEISLVTFPLLPGARVGALKADPLRDTCPEGLAAAIRRATANFIPHERTF